MRPTRNGSRFAVFTALLLLGLLLAACSSSSKKTSAAFAAQQPSSSTTTSADPAGAAEQPITIKILGGSANSGVIPYADKTGILARALAKVNAKVQWVDGPAAFSANLDAMKTGNITASEAAVSPIIGALIAGLDFKIFAVGPSPTVAGEAGILVPKRSSITTVQGLVGKKVAVNPAAHGEYILLKALEQAGIPFGEVHRVEIQPPEAAVAFSSGSVDAWATFNTFYTGAIAQGARVLVDEADLDSDDVTVIAASSSQLAENPAAFKTIVDVYNQLTEESHTNPEKFQNIWQQSGPTAVSGALLAAQILQTKEAPTLELVTPAGIARVQAVLDIFAKAGVLQKSVPVNDVVFDISAALQSK
jgi:sulfonate transport system substrate-binding protein